MNKVSVLVPTRGRISRLQTLCQSFQATTHGGLGAELVFRVDEDDVESRIALGQYKKVVGPRLRGYASMATFYNDVLCIADGDVLMCGNDDMVFRTDGWPELILAAARRYDDGLFNIGVSTFNEDHYPFSTVSRKMVEALGFLWDPRIYWGDIFLRDVMGTLGRSIKLPSVAIDHDWAGNAPDLVFLEEDQNDIYRRDPTYWSTTHPQIVAEAVARLLPHVGVYVCVPVLKRYDLLRKLLESLRQSTVTPHVVIIDNGRNAEKMQEATDGFTVRVLTSVAPMGLAEAWNWFIKNVPETRVIVNDDIEFAPESLARMISTPGDFVSALAGSNACSCFLLRDSCVEKVGLFDETISPGYAYYEDCDYVERMLVAGTHITSLECGVLHAQSQTTAAYTAQEWERHHDKFMIAQSNFVKKWGRMPDLSRVIV